MKTEHERTATGGMPMSERQAETNAEVGDEPEAHGLPDAIIVPLGFARGDSSQDRLQFLKSRLASAMGIESIAVFNQGTFYFVAPTPDQTLLYPADDPRHPSPRYDWREQEDGVRFGYLIEEA